LTRDFIDVLQAVRFSNEVLVRRIQAAEDPFVIGPKGISDIPQPQFVPVVKTQAPVQPPLGFLGATSSKLSATASNFTPSNLAELNATSVPDYVDNRHHDQPIRNGVTAYLASNVVGDKAHNPPVKFTFGNKPQAVLGHDKPLTNTLGVHHLAGVFTVDLNPEVDHLASTRYVRLHGVADFEMEDEAAAEGHLGHIKQVSALPLLHFPTPLRSTLYRNSYFLFVSLFVLALSFFFLFFFSAFKFHSCSSSQARDHIPLPSLLSLVLLVLCILKSIFISFRFCYFLFFSSLLSVSLLLRVLLSPFIAGGSCAFPGVVYDIESCPFDYKSPPFAALKARG
jgi:hypothetical protein